MPTVVWIDTNVNFEVGQIAQDIRQRSIAAQPDGVGRDHFQMGWHGGRPLWSLGGRDDADVQQLFECQRGQIRSGLSMRKFRPGYSDDDRCRRSHWMPAPSARVAWVRGRCCGLHWNDCWGTVEQGWCPTDEFSDGGNYLGNLRMSSADGVCTEPQHCARWHMCCGFCTVCRSIAS